MLEESLEVKLVSYVSIHKIRQINSIQFTKNKKLYTSEELTTVYCKEYSCYPQFGDCLSFFKSLLKTWTEEKKENRPENNDLRLFDTEKSKQRFKQMFFCDSPQNRGYILTPDKAGSVTVSEKMHSIEIFKKDLSLLDSGEYEAFKNWGTKNLIVGDYEYKPWGKVLSSNESDVYVLNVYRPPEWLSPQFSTITWDQLSIEMRCFYQQLFPEKSQREYALNWMLCSLICNRDTAAHKLTTYLTLIGKGGIGKGIMSERHLKALHGRHNWQSTRIGNMKERFSLAPCYRKTIVLFNEASIQDEEHYDIIKGLESDELEVEKKQQDAQMEKVYFSSVWSCNRKNKLQYLEKDDRRFAFLDLTEEPLLNKTVQDELTGESIKFTREVMDMVGKDNERIRDLIRYLLGRTPDFKLAESVDTGALNKKIVLERSRPEWSRNLKDILFRIDWDNPSGTGPLTIGFTEIRLSKVPHYTYDVKSSALERLRHLVLKNRSISWTALEEEIGKYDEGEIRAFRDGGSSIKQWGIRIRHPEHEAMCDKIQKMGLS